MSNFRIVETEGHFQPQYSFFERRLFKKNYLKWNVILINETFWYDTYEDALEVINNTLKVKVNKSIIHYLK